MRRSCSNSCTFWNGTTRLGILEEGNRVLGEPRCLMREGTIVDATIIAALASTKNQAQTHDSEMHQTKKGNLIGLPKLDHSGS